MRHAYGLSAAALLVLLTLQASSVASGRWLRDAPGPLQAEAPGSATLPAPGPADGSVDVSADIFNGQPAPTNAFPWMVNMKVWTQSQTTGEIALSHMCGGSLIGPDAVLTAAHCLHFEDGSAMPLDALVLEVSGMQYQARSYIVHPSYDPAALARQNADFSDNSVDSPLVANYDIAVIRLASPVPNAPLIQLPTADLQLAPGQALEVAGWGRTGSDESLPASDTLLYASLQYAAPFDFANPGAPGTCPSPSFTDTICGVNYVNGANSCAGDSGGPLILRDYLTGAAVQVGIVSNGPACDQLAFANYTDIRRYLAELAAWTA
ncbi:hypothetical protein ABPG77_009453 [Micractinium sp. CCAP 211/92]